MLFNCLGLSFHICVLYVLAAHSMNWLFHSHIIKDNNWTAYTDNCLHKTLIANNLSYRPLTFILQKLRNNSYKLYNLRSGNFSHFSIISTVVGTIHCCSGFSLLGTEKKNISYFPLAISTRYKTSNKCNSFGNLIY